MLRLKILAGLSILSFVGIVLVGAERHVASAPRDTITDQIAGYKSWTKVTEKPILVDRNIAVMG